MKVDEFNQSGARATRFLLNLADLRVVAKTVVNLTTQW
jgi:hypothetical protein